ncbi:MAG: hypothetical protein K6E31_01420 [bacterium]|nr:hypothetical protein [bacterium]
MNKLDDIFITGACNILAETNSGLSGSQILEYCSSYAINYNKVIPYGSTLMGAPNKRTALKENLRIFDAVEQFRIIKDLCELPMFQGNEQVSNLKIMLYKRYGNLSKEKISETELIQTTKHWLSGYSNALKQYESALSKFEGGIFERNTLDDMRLSFELLVKALLSNEKSLENQIAGICTLMEQSGASAELRNMVQPVIKYYTDFQNHHVKQYYTDFQNHHVKHNDKINNNELEYVIELTSVIMKFLIKANGDKN